MLQKGHIDEKGGGPSRIDALKGNKLIEIKSTGDPATSTALMKKVAGAIFNPVSKNVDAKASQIASNKALSKKVDTIGFGGLTVFEDSTRLAQKKMEDRAKKTKRPKT